GSCESARGESGKRFVEALARSAGADVAAASGLVGHAGRGGRWTLDVAPAALPLAAPITAQAIAAYQGLLNDGFAISGTDNNSNATIDVTGNSIIVTVTGSNDVVNVTGTADTVAIS